MPFGFGCCCSKPMNLQKMDPVTGNVIWTANIGNTIVRMEPLPGTNDIVAVVDGILTRIDSSGSVVWQFTTAGVQNIVTGDRIGRCIAVGDPSYSALIVFSDGSALRGVDFNGNLIWTTAVGGTPGNGVQIFESEAFYGTLTGGFISGVQVVDYRVYTLSTGAQAWNSYGPPDNAPGTQSNGGNRGLWLESICTAGSGDLFNVLDTGSPIYTTVYPTSDVEGLTYLTADQGFGFGQTPPGLRGPASGGMGTAHGTYPAQDLVNACRQSINAPGEFSIVGMCLDVTARDAYYAAYSAANPGVTVPYPSGPCLMVQIGGGGLRWQLTTIPIVTGGSTVNVPIGGMRDFVSATPIPLSTNVDLNSVFWVGNPSNGGAHTDPLQWFHIVAVSQGTPSDYAAGHQGTPMWVASYGSFDVGSTTAAANACCISADGYLYVGGQPTFADS